MIKMKVLIFMAILILTLTGCGKAGQERLIIYSFSGENEQLAVSNGIIVLNGTEETFVGGDLKVTGDFFDDITSYSTTFYTMSGSERVAGSHLVKGGASKGGHIWKECRAGGLCGLCLYRFRKKTDGSIL